MVTWFVHGFDAQPVQRYLTHYVERHGEFNYGFGFAG